MVEAKTQSEIDKIRESCQIVAKVFEKIREHLKVGISLLEIDRLVETYIRQSGAVPAFLGYRGYPNSTCLSVNAEVVHGIPDGRLIAPGDVLGVDLGTIFKGFFGDAAFTFTFDPVNKKTAKLIKAGQEAMWAGISQARAGNHVGDIGAAIEASAKKSGFQVVKTLYGHGVGKQLHEDPLIPNYGKPGTGPLLKAGMVLAIEPMLNLGTGEVETLEDGWTVVTKDRKISVHFERTVLVRDKEPEILTRFYE